MPRGKDQLTAALGRYSLRKKTVVGRFSGILGILTNGVQTVEVSNRPGFVWVRLRNVDNEVIQAYNETVSQTYDLPVIVERDKNHPTRYHIIERDIERYANWPSNSAYLPIHGQSHSFNRDDSGTGGDVVWAYQEQFLPLLVSPSGTFGANNVIIFPGLYVNNDNFKYAGNTGTADLLTYKPTGSSNASILLISLEEDTGNFLITQGNEFDNTITGTAEVVSYLPAPPDGASPLSGVRLVSGTSSIRWDNLYDVRSFNGYTVANQVQASGLAGDGLVPSGTVVHMGVPSSITDTTLNSTSPSSHTHQLGPLEVVDAGRAAFGGDADEVGLLVISNTGQTNPVVRISSENTGGTYTGFARRGALYLGAFTSQNLAAGDSINSVYPSYVRINGSGGDVVLTSNPQITSGDHDGQIILLQGDDSTQTVTIVDGNGLDLKTATYTIYEGDWIMLMWDDDNSLWSEVNRSSPLQEQTWAFRSLVSGSIYALGFYKFGSSDDDFSPAIDFGGADTASGAKVFVVLGEVSVDEITIRVQGSEIQSGGSAVTNQTFDIVIPSGAAVNTYYETDTYFTGQVNISTVAGTAKLCNYGLVRAWNKFNDKFRVTGVGATWLGGATDTEPDLLLRHHKNTGWTYNASSAPTPPTSLASMATDYGDDKDLASGEQGSWYRDNLTALISGSSQGLLLEVKTSVEDAFALGNFTVQYRPDW